MSKSVVESIDLGEFSLWHKLKAEKNITSFDLELTARCNNNCKHCYINLPVGDKVAKKEELSPEEIERIADEAVSLGAIWCLITGGEPLLRQDFFDIYLYLKRKGLLISLFTNANLIRTEHIELFKKYPPRDIEVSVYGVTKETYERVTRVPGSFATFMRALDLLLENGFSVRLKAMALRSNVHEMSEIARFCRKRTKDFFRFDTSLHLRLDGDPARNEDIKSERLSPAEAAILERSDPERLKTIEKMCEGFGASEGRQPPDNNLFRCGVGSNITIGHNGFLRLCASLCHPDYVYDLRKGSLIDAWRDLLPQVRNMRSNRKEFVEKCQRCQLINICLWCPANAYVETGEMDVPVDYFCKMAHARAAAVALSKT
ncbi:radical SAM protein [Candidatus Poribacteria bacterium]